MRGGGGACAGGRPRACGARRARPLRRPRRAGLAGARRRAARAGGEPRAHVLYASATGRTAACAQLVAARLGAGLVCASDAALEPGLLRRGTLLVVGAPTWATGAGEMRTGTALDDWLWALRRAAARGQLPLEGVHVAAFGLGDGVQWPLHFCDALGELAAVLEEVGGRPVGRWEPRAGEGYLCEASRASVEGRGCAAFVGLPLDEARQGELTEARIAAWCAQLRREAAIGVGDGACRDGDAFGRLRERARAHYAPPEATLAPSPPLAHALPPPMLFGRPLDDRWYQLGGGPGGNANGRWVRIGQDALRVRAGLRGQPEFRVPYASICGMHTVHDDVPGAFALVCDLLAAGDAQAREKWGPMLVLRGLTSEEADRLGQVIKALSSSAAQLNTIRRGDLAHR